MMTDCQIRAYQLGDHFAIAIIFSRAVHEIAIRDYTADQCLAWSERRPNPEHWEERCKRKQPIVALVGDEIAGFLELDPDGHIDCAYVNPDFQRRGIMTSLVEHAIEAALARGLTRVFVEASIGARFLFEGLGFNLLSEREVTIGELKLRNYEMERVLALPFPSLPFNDGSALIHNDRVPTNPPRRLPSAGEAVTGTEGGDWRLAAE